MTPSDLTQWRKSLGLTEREGAALLQTPVATYRSWEDGRYRIPGVTAVAVRYITLYRDLYESMQRAMVRDADANNKAQTNDMPQICR